MERLIDNRLEVLVSHIDKIGAKDGTWSGILTIRQQVDALNAYYNYYLCDRDFMLYGEKMFTIWKEPLHCNSHDKLDPGVWC